MKNNNVRKLMGNYDIYDRRSTIQMKIDSLNFEIDHLSIYCDTLIENTR